MRYIDLGSYYIPKHCKYGPRPIEGIILSELEWLSITDHLIKGQREKAIAMVQTAKEDMKKNISLEMTKNWNNTLASVNTWKEKRAEKIAKENEEKSNRYNEILKNREEEDKLIVKNMKNVKSEYRDSTKIINAGILHSVVLDERQNQIKLKDSIKNQEKLKSMEEAKRIKREIEEFRMEELQNKIKVQMQKRKQKDFLDKQMEEIRVRQKELEVKREREKQDLINMRIEEEKIQRCVEAEKKSKKELAAKLNEITQSKLEYQRNLLLEDEEEDEIHKIFIRFQRKFEKARKEKEKKLLEEKIEFRQKSADQIAKKMVEAKKKDEEKLNSAIKIKEQEETEEEKNKEELRRQQRQEMLDAKKKMNETLAQQKYDEFEKKKWEMMQIYKTHEINCEWKQEQRQKLIEAKARTRKEYDKQIKELEEERAKELKDRFGPVERDLQEIQDVIKQCNEAIDFAKEYNTPLYPILTAVARVKKDYGLLEKNQESFNETCEKKMEQKKMQKNLGEKCICLTY